MSNKISFLMYVFLIAILMFFFVGNCCAEEAVFGKDVFYTVKGPYGACNTCHPNGGSAGRWDSEYQEISDDGDKAIPSLKGIGKTRSKEQIGKAVNLVMKKYKVPVKESQLNALVDYVSGL